MKKKRIRKKERVKRKKRKLYNKEENPEKIKTEENRKLVTIVSGPWCVARKCVL